MTGEREGPLRLVLHISRNYNR